jgi:hypothetical protein
VITVLSTPSALRPGAVIVRATEGEAAEPFLVFQAGFAVGPFSLGHHGDWQVRAQGVVPVHLYLWFDGLVLHAARVQGAPAVLARGEPLGEDWLALSDGAELQIGDAKVTVSAQTELEDSKPGGMPQLDEARAAATGDYAAGSGSAAKGNVRGSLLSRLGLVKARRPTLRGLLLLTFLPTALLLWLFTTPPSAAERKPESTPKSRSARSAPSPSSSAERSTDEIEKEPRAPESEPEPREAEPEATEPALHPGADRALERRGSATRPVSRMTVRDLEREAVDLVLRGDYRAASEIYAELSALFPDSKGFATARRVSARRAEP